MTALVATERHLLLNLSNIREKDKKVLMDVPLWWLLYRSSSPVALIYLGLLGESSPKHLKPAPYTVSLKNRALLLVFPLKTIEEWESTLNRSLQGVRQRTVIISDCLRLRGKGADARGVRPLRAVPPEVEWLTTHYTMPDVLRSPPP